VLVELPCRHVTELFAGFGQKGVRAETVGASVWENVAAYLAADVPVGPFLADQWMLLLALAARCGSGGSFLTGPLTAHAETHARVIQKFLDVALQFECPTKNADDKRVVVRLQ
jgi:RNA 3'-terminal phosphate cyclase (ATP)